MCLVVDTCALSPVFVPNDKRHCEFKPVYNWVSDANKKGVVIYGGTKYKKELKRSSQKVIRQLRSLEKAGRVKILKDSEVDNIQKTVRDREENPSFNDPHIVAIVIASSCRIVCTTDSTSHKFLKKNSLYGGRKPPSIYSQKSHRKLLNNRNIVGVCCK